MRNVSHGKLFTLTARPLQYGARTTVFLSLCDASSQLISASTMPKFSSISVKLTELPTFTCLQTLLCCPS